MEFRHAISRQVAEEYALSTRRAQELLRHCGVSEEYLSKDARACLRVLSEAAEILQLGAPTTGNYLMAMSELEDSLARAEAEASSVRKEASASQKRSQALLREWKDLESTRQQLEDAVEERETHENTTAMEQSTVEHMERQRAYEVELEGLTRALEGLEFDTVQDKVEHHNLSSLEKECQDVESENDALREQLQQYHDLPLNKSVATAKLFEAREELHRLEDHFNSQIKEML